MFQLAHGNGEIARDLLGDAGVCRGEDSVRKFKCAPPTGAGCLDRNGGDHRDNQNDAEDRYADAQHRPPAFRARGKWISGNVDNELSPRHRHLLDGGLA